MTKKKETICFACSIFKNELEQLKTKKGMNLTTKYLSSMLHMKPEILDQQIKSEISKNKSNDKNVVLVFGDCSPNMEHISNEKGVTKLNGINCIEILLGKDIYRKLRKEGVFFLMPEWTMRWKEVFQQELGLRKDIARELMGEMHTRIIYIDTGQVDIPFDKIEEIEDYTGLKTEIMTVDFSQLHSSLSEAIDENV